MTLWPLSLGLAGVALGWLITRRAAGLRGAGSMLIGLDLALPLGLFALLLSLGARPLFSGLLVAAAGLGFAAADRAKRRTLREPIVFTDAFQALDIFRHPELAAPFPNRLPIAMGFLALIALFALLFALEPARAPLRLPAMLCLLGWIGVAALLAGPARASAARWLRRCGLHGDPVADARHHGLLATLLGHGLIAGAERAQRRAAAGGLPIPSAAAPKGGTARVPLLLVQCESFFDARRLDAAVIPTLLPAYDACRAEALQWGRLQVPCWGANTVRTEFAVLSGLPEAALGMDRFNPYHRFARQRLATLVWQLRAQGYRTICVHPFDGRFYARDRVMPQLGFEHFFDERAFVGAPRVNGLVSDLAVAEVIDTLVAEHRGRLFVFAITLENHGPWSGAALPPGPRLAPGTILPGPDAAAFERYLASLQNGDRLLAALTRQRDDGRLVGFYGDHQPSLPMASAGSPDSDYLLWRAKAPAAPIARPLPAWQLGQAFLEAALLPA